jgi:hypothetical protein
MPFVWAIGTIIGPAIGGTFANPCLNFPAVFSRHGVFAQFPYLLPNLICAAFLLLSILAGYFLLQETHPDLAPPVNLLAYSEDTDQTPLITAAGANANPEIDLRKESYGTFNEINTHEEGNWYTSIDGSSPLTSINEKSRPKPFTRQVLMLVIALGIFTYHSMTYDHLLPIFLQDDRMPDMSSFVIANPFHIPGGLGLTTKSVGLIMSVNGLIALLIQGVIFPVLADWLGIWRVFVLVTVLHPIAYFIVPYLALLPDHLVYPGIYVCLTIRNILAILAYPVILILLKQASPAPSVLGKINGLAASAGAACRTIAPPVAGLLYGIGTNIGFTGLAWWGSGLVAIMGALQLWLVPREKNGNTTMVSSLPPCISKVQLEHRMTNVAKVEVPDMERA